MTTESFDSRMRRLKELEIELNTALIHVHESLAQYDGTPKNYLNGVEILGSPKTVRLEFKFRGEIFSAPLEVWFSALVATMSAQEKERLFSTVRHLEARRMLSPNQARVVADIPAPTPE